VHADKRQDLSFTYLAHHEPESVIVIIIIITLLLLLLLSLLLLLLWMLLFLFQHAGWLAVGHCLGRRQADLQLCCAYAALDVFRQAPALPSEGFDAFQPHLTASTWLTCHRLTSAVALHCLNYLQDE